MRGPAVLLFLLAAFTGSAAGVRKQWRLNWDLNSRDNWKENRLPCAGGAATLPKYPENSLFLGGDLTLGSLDLPVEGEVIFGTKANMLFDDSPNTRCSGAEWTRRGSDQWWDPSAWSNPEFEDATSSPVPHLHRVPCVRDTAVFASPNDSLYTVHFTPPPVSVTTLTIGRKNFTTSGFAAYTRTPEGAMRFKGASSTTDGAPLYVESPRECMDLTGCFCGSEHAASIICRIMSAKCGTPRCGDPIDMTGFCCPVCGAEVTIDHGGTLPLEAIKNLVQSLLQMPAMKDVRGHVAKMGDQKYHVYFTAANPNGDYREASETFKKKFIEEIQMAETHEVLVSYAGDMKPLVYGKVAPHQVTVTLVTLAICLVIGAAIYYLRKRRGTSSISFMFRRLENNSRRVSVVSDVIGGRRPSNASGVFAYSREGGLRFLNPIFNQSMASLSGVGASSVVNEAAQEPPTEQAEGQHENPMYTAYEKMQPEERQASEEAIREREKILEAAGQLVASMEASQKKRMSAGHNLEAISEESAKEDTHDTGKHEGEDTEGTTQKAESSTTEAEELVDIQQDGALVEEDKDEVREGDEEATKPQTDESEVMKEEPPSVPEVSQSIIDIDGIPSSSGHVEQRPPTTSSSSSSSDDDDDTDAALSNLEGFTPLVDLKFKK